MPGGDDLRLWAVPVGPLRVNCYLLAAEGAPEAAVIDPGDEAEAILARARDEGLQVRAVLLTHAHWDHIGAVAEVAEATGAPVMLHRADQPLLDAWSPRPVQPACFLDQGDEVRVGAVRLQVLHTPGHTPGGLCFLAGRHLFTGDTLFAGAVGRWDFPGGSEAALRRSLRERILVLPDDLSVHPGHGPDTTIGDERRDNPYLADL